MKKIVLAVCCASLIWAGCKENDMPINFGTTSVSDTTYVLAPSAIPALDSHNVLVEEFTGQSCSNCPAAHASLDAIIAQPGYGTRVNIVCLYPLSGIAGPQTIPPPGAAYNFTDSSATSVLTGIYGALPGLPSAGFDRTVFNGAIINLPGGWGSFIDTRKVVTDSLNLSVKSIYNTATKTATITAIVTYLDSVSVNHNLSIVVVEDSITDFQEKYASGSTFIDSTYLFNDVFRAMLTSVPGGDPLPVAKGKGRVYQRVYTYTPMPHYPSELAPVVAHLRVIAFVNCANPGDYHVVQSMQAKLMGP